MVDLTVYSGPGMPGAGMAGEYVQADGPFNWAASTAFTPQMAKGLDPGHTILAQKITILLAYTAAPASQAFTEQNLIDFYNNVITRIVGQSSAAAIVSDGEVMGAGDLARLNRLGLRVASGGTLDQANGLYTIGASGTLEIEILIPHANPNTGLDYAPDSGLIGSRTWQITTGAAAVSLGSASLTFTSGVIYTGNIIIRGRPGAKRHLRYKRVSSTDPVDSLEPATRVAHLVVGSNARTYAQALSDRGVDPTADPYTVTYGGRNPFSSQGYLNNALIWNETLAKSSGGRLPFPGPAGEGGMQSLACTPLYVWNGAAPGDTVSGPVVVNNATNLAASSRTHDTLDLVGG